MPIKQAAKKALRQTVTRSARNLTITKKIDFLERSLEKALKAASASDAEKLLRELHQTLDKAAKRHVFHANRSARKKSRLTRAVNALKKK